MEFEAGLRYVKAYLKTKIIMSHDYTHNLLKWPKPKMKTILVLASIKKSQEISLTASG